MRNSHNVFWGVQSDDSCDETKDKKTHCHAVNLVIIVVIKIIILLKKVFTKTLMSKEKGWAVLLSFLTLESW